MLDYDRVDADGVLSRIPLSFAYASAWAAVLGYTQTADSDQRATYSGKPVSTRSTYYHPGITADHASVRVSGPHWRFTVYLVEEPIVGGASACVGMWGEPIDEDLCQRLMLSVRHLPYSSLVSEKIIEKSDFLDENPMYRGLPGVAAKHETPGQSATETARPRDW
jgi:hypothetical protein